MRKYIIIIIAVLFLGFVVVRLISNKKEINKNSDFKEEISQIPVKTTMVSEHLFTDAFEYVGTFLPSHEVTVGAEMGGKVLQVLFEEGQFVSRGQALVKIDDTLLKIQLEAQTAAWEKAQEDLVRFENLLKDGATAEINFKNAKLGVASAEAQMNATKEQIARCTVYAPLSGYVTNKMTEVGAMLGPGVPVCMITDISTLEFAVMVPEKDILSFKIGQQLPIRVEAFGNETVNGTVSLIGMKSDPSHSVKVEYKVNNLGRTQPVKAGMYGYISGTTSAGDKPVLAIPRSALAGDAGNPLVYIVKDGTAVATKVTLGKTTDDWLEVVQGLKKGDMIVVSGQINLKDGASVVVQ